MNYSFVVIAVTAALVGCATHSKPDYETVTNFTPDCANEAAQIRYLSTLKQYDSRDVSNVKYNKTIDIQIERLKYYCRNAY